MFFYALYVEDNAFVFVFIFFVFENFSTFVQFLEKS